jgi:ACR3 family arsenite efflux pump ArsB
LFSLDELVNAFVLILLIEMMVATGLGVSFGDLRGVVKNAGLLALAALANYVLVPTAACSFYICSRPILWCVPDLFWLPCAPRPRSLRH